MYYNLLNFSVAFLYDWKKFMWMGKKITYLKYQQDEIYNLNKGWT